MFIIPLVLILRACRLDEATLMSRCGVCNAAAYTRISHEEAAAHVSARLLELVQEFWQCGRCVGG